MKYSEDKGIFSDTEKPYKTQVEESKQTLKQLQKFTKQVKDSGDDALMKEHNEMIDMAKYELAANKETLRQVHKNLTDLRKGNVSNETKLEAIKAYNNTIRAKRIRTAQTVIAYSLLAGYTGYGAWVAMHG